jgi:hypothetical protein
VHRGRTELGILSRGSWIERKLRNIVKCRGSGITSSLVIGSLRGQVEQEQILAPEAKDAVPVSVCIPSLISRLGIE